MKQLRFTILFLGCVLASSTFAQVDSALVQPTTKTILWTKFENGDKLQLIREGNHEYILRTPMQQLNQAYRIDSTSMHTNTHSIIPEVQTDELIRSRLLYMNSRLPLTYNSEVSHQVNRLLRYRENLEMNLGRSQYYMPMIDSIVASKGLPHELKYLPLVESEYKVGGKSRRGARGIWQFMSPTARMYGLKVSSAADYRLHPEESTSAAFTYLADLYEMFYDWELALAAYNAGPGRVQRAMRATGLANPTFWDIRHLLAKETRDYVPKFTAAVYVMSHYSQIGLLPNHEGTTDAANQVAALEKTGYRITWNRNIDASAIPENSVALNYTVKSGDNIGFIAEWYDVKANQIRAWNGISGNLIKPGQELAIYVPKDKEQVYASIDKLTFDQKQGSNEEERAKKEEEKLAALREAKANYVVYTIQNGDTLWDISKKNGVSVETIKQLNNISNTRNLKPGMVLKIREK